MYLAPSKHIIMNKFKFYFILFSTLLVLFSCNNDDDEDVVTPLNDYGLQFAIDLANIKTYLKTHKLNPEITDYAKNVNSSNLFINCNTDDTEALFNLNETTNPKLLSKLVTVESHNSTKYKIYYLVFNEGNSTQKPCPLDEVLVTYRGTSLKNDSGVVSATEFTNIPNNSKLTLSSTIGGWQEIFPMFGKGIFDEVATGNGPNVYTNYGAGIMFLPSGLAYYNESRTNIPIYSPLVFSFQLLNFKRSDNDNDGILTIDEIVRNTDGSFTYTNTDGDDYDDFADFDDDNDGFPTRNEIKKTDGTLYLFNEIPGCDGLATDPNRTKRHLIKCQ